MVPRGAGAFSELARLVMHRDSTGRDPERRDPKGETMIRGIHHVALCTHDLDRLVAFYRDVVGFEQVMSTSWRDRPIIDRMIGVEGSAARQVMLRAGNACLELFEYESPSPTPADPQRGPAHQGYTHLCLDVVDIDAEHARLSANGMTFHDVPPTTDELGHARLRAIYGRDPDGNIVELQEVLDPDVPFALDFANRAANDAAPTAPTASPSSPASPSSTNRVELQS